MEFHILGPLEVIANGRALDLGGQKQRALLAILLLEPNRVVSAAGSNAAFTTDTLAPGGGSAQTQGYRFVTDTLAPGGGIVAVSPGVQGFDWTDAGIGAGGTIGLMVILLGCTRHLSHRRSALAV